MMTGTSTQASRPLTSTVGLSAPAPTTSGDSSSLLPAPSAGPGSVYSLSLVLEGFVLNQRRAALTTGEVSINENDALKTKALADQKKADDQRIEASADKGGFFGDLVKVIKDCTVDILTGRLDKCAEDLNDEMLSDPQFWKDLEAAGGEIAKWGAVVGSIAVAVVTCGSASAGAVAVILAVVGASLSTAGVVESETHALEAIGIDPKAASWIQLSLSCAGALCTGGAGLASTAEAAQGFAKTVGTISTISTGSASVAEGAGTAGTAHFEGMAEDAAADSKDAQVRQDQIQNFIEKVLDQMKDTYDSARASLQTLASAARADLAAKNEAVRA